jgi:hypothetical protein
MIDKADGQVCPKTRKNRQNSLRTGFHDQNNRNQRQERAVFMKKEAQNLFSWASGAHNRNI